MFPWMVAVPNETHQLIAGAVVRARIAAGLKHESLASLMGISPAQLTQQLSGLGHLSAPRLLMVSLDPDGRVFWQHFLPALGELAGVEQTDAVASLLARAVGLLERRQMVKAELVNSEQERRRA